MFNFEALVFFFTTALTVIHTWLTDLFATLTAPISPIIRRFRLICAWIDDGFDAGFCSRQNLGYNLSAFYLCIYLALSVYTVNYYVCYFRLMFPYETSEFGYMHHGSHSDWQIGLALLILLSFLKANWVASWIFCLVHTWWLSKQWRPRVPSQNAIMQTHEWQIQMKGLDLAPGYRPRRCTFTCKWPHPSDSDYPSGHSQIPDRVYHCTTLRRCLPCYDHFCSWIRVAVYLQTFKAYMCFNAYLALDCALTLVTAIIALTMSGSPIKELVPIAVTIAVVSIVIGGHVVWIARHETILICMRNQLGSENGMLAHGEDPWLLVFRVPEAYGHYYFKPHSFKDNPFDLGPRENVRQTLGEWWTWPFFWIQPPRVKRYGNYANQWDVPFNAEVRRYRDQLMDPKRSRVDASRSSTSQVESTTRRRQNRSSNVSRRQQQRSTREGSGVHVDTSSSVYSQ
ncbi:hypothetical protein F5Y16DRAFT_263439 [Xylariaceae sp. FL0255]|nr:hypothetical protein F5Y16DRAFT_263439 [Xylariaceae sp. FL0255]